jgi:hypothetical protein
MSRGSATVADGVGKRSNLVALKGIRENVTNPPAGPTTDLL